MLTFAQVCERVKSDLVAMETASHAQSLCFWGEEDDYNHVECEAGQRVRLKTRGDSILIGKGGGESKRSTLSLSLESFTKLDSDQRAHSSNYTGGEKTGQSWTDKVMGHKTTSEETPVAAGGGGEVEEDEWVSEVQY